jgi:uncharacterized peroxidase-related enzyme
MCALSLSGPSCNHGAGRGKEDHRWPGSSGSTNETRRGCFASCTNSTADGPESTTSHHGAGLRRLIRDEQKVNAVASDFHQAGLLPRERAILDYAVKLTASPEAMEPGDLDSLRVTGLSDAEILDVCQVTAYYNYVNRLADGLGVELEPYWQDSP